VTWFPGPHSYTGEDSAEFSLHASPYVVQRFLALCTDLPGVRMAGPGEFTWRAFANGKMDLSRAEAVADLIAAENPMAHRLAMNQLEGGFARKIAMLRERMTEFAALLELELDFSQEDVEFADRSALRDLVQSVREQVVSLRDSFAAGEVKVFPRSWPVDPMQVNPPCSMRCCKRTGLWYRINRVPPGIPSKSLVLLMV
jgi:tRNA modification GTPase